MNVDLPPNAPDRDSGESPNTIMPLEGEPGIPNVARAAGFNVSRKGIVAIGLLALSLIAISAVSINRALSSKKDSDEPSRRMGDRPAAAANDPRRLDMSLPPVVAPAPAVHVIPAIVPTADEARGESIGVRRTEPARIAPEDAPVLLVSSRLGGTADSVGRRPQGTAAAEPSAVPDDNLDGTRRSLQAYQRQLQGLLDSLSKGGALSGGAIPGVASTVTAAAAPVASLLGGELPKSATPRVVAGQLGNRSLTLPKGTAFTCALKTKLISAASGFVGCQVLRNVYSDDGRVLLIERGSHMDGEYRIASVQPGTVRIPVLWTRIRTPLGVTVDIESPGTGALGESGIDGFVDNRWPERIGAALLLSLIDDSVKLAIADKSTSGTGDTILLPSTTSSTSKLAEKVLDSTINIPPLIYQNQGGIVGIYVARDVDFSTVYELKAVER